MLDTIHLENIESFCRLGVYEEERASGQNIKVNLALELDLRKAGQSDDLQDTVDYAKISKLVQDCAQAKEYLLVEHLAEEIAQKILSDFVSISGLKIRVFKPTIITAGFSGDVSVEIYRQQK